MADVSVKMGVSGIQQFKTNMKDAQASVKTLDAALKANEKQLKATGNAEEFMKGQATILNSKLREQQNIAKNAEAALKQMEQNGVKTTSKAYQDMQRTLIEANSAMLDTQMELDNMGKAAVEASTDADKLGNSLGGISKKMSLQQVISGINTITEGLEKAAQKAVKLGEAIWSQVLESAGWADDTATMAAVLGMDVEDYQKYKKVFDTVGEITVQEWAKVKQKVQKAIVDPSNDQEDILSLLGISTQQWSTVAGQSGSSLVTRPWEDIFWEAGQKLRQKVAEGLMSQDQADVYAQALFGKGFASLNPLLGMGREAFEAALNDQTVNTEEEVSALAALNDQLLKLQGDFATLETKLMAGLAPALEGAAKALDGLLGRILEYLDSEEGQKALDDMAKAVEGLFSDISNIDPQQVVEGFTSVFNTIVGGLQWLVDNKDTVVTAMEAIVAGWGLLKLTGGALKIADMVNGIHGLGGGAAAAAEAGASTGASWGTAFAGAVMKAVPWLVGLYTLLNPAASAGEQVDNLVDSNGKVTEAGRAAGITETEAEEIYDEEQRLRKQKEAMLELTGLSEKQYKLLQSYWTYYSAVAAGNASEFEKERYATYGKMLATTFQGQEDQLGAYLLKMQDRAGQGLFDGRLDFSWFDIGEDGATLKVSLEVPEDEDQRVAEQVGTVHLNGIISLAGVDMGKYGDYGNNFTGHANGLWSVPFDGYPALLHRGEQVVPARAVEASRSYTSNNYFGNVNLNNGMEIEQLTESIDRQNRKTMKGYGG